MAETTKETMTIENDVSVEELGVRVMEDVDEDAIAEKVPPLSSSKFALRNSLKLLDGKYGGSFRVRYVLDDVQKHGWLELLIEYPDSTVKGIYLFKNAFRQTDTESSGVYHSDGKKTILRLDGYEDCDFRFVKNFETPDMTIPAKDIWDLIQANYHNIPIVKINKTSSLETVYLEMAVLAATYAKGVGLSFMDTEESFSVTTKDFRTIATRHGWVMADLRNEFDKAGLFIKDKTGGFQKSKKINGKHLHYYVLRKELPCDEDSVTSLEDTTYRCGEPNQLERMKKKYEAELKRLRDEIQNAIDGKRPPNAMILI